MPIEESLVVRALAGAAVAGIIAAVAVKTRALTESGRWAAFVTGVLAAAAGWWWALTLIAFFVASAWLTHWRSGEKASRTESALPHATARSATQVVANGGLFVLLACWARSSGGAWQGFAALGALAAASSDSWSTEVGTLLGGTPRLITTGARIEPGMSGGVTVAGIGAGISGALFVGLLGAFADPAHYAKLAAAATLGGFGGGLADSLAGAALQSRRYCDQCGRWTERRVHSCGYRTRHARGIIWMSNDLVNMFGTVAGAALAALAGWWMGR